MERRGAALLRKTLVANFRELRQGEVHGRRESLHSHVPNGPGPQARGRSIARYCASERWAKPIAILGVWGGAKRRAGGGCSGPIIEAGAPSMHGRTTDDLA